MLIVNNSESVAAAVGKWVLIGLVRVIGEERCILIECLPCAAVWSDSSPLSL